MFNNIIRYGHVIPLELKWCTDTLKHEPMANYWFHCNNCGCIFETDKIGKPPYSGFNDDYFVFCPCCKNVILNEEAHKYLENEEKEK